MANMIFNLDLNKNNAINPIIYGRLTDGNLRKITVNITNEGEPVNLTGWTIRFEGVTGGQAKVFDVMGVNVLDAKNGKFEYTFSKTAFSASGAYRQAYFAIEKDDMRETTTDIKIVVENVADLDAQDAETVVTELNKTIALINQRYEELNSRVDGYENDITDLEDWLASRKAEVEDLIDLTTENFNEKLTEIQEKLDATNKAIEKGNETIAYAYSADGTDGFTTTYPNMNLGDNTKLFTGANGGNGLTGSVRIDPNTVISKDGEFNYLTLKSTKNNNDWFRYYLLPNPGTPNMTKIPIIPNTNYTFSAYLKGSGTHRIIAYDKWTVPNPYTLNVELTDQWKLYTFTVKSSATLPDSDAQFFIRSDIGTEINLKKPKLEKGSVATPWMPSAIEATNADYPTFIGYSNTVKTNKVASDYKWFPTIDSHTSNKSNPHAVTAEQTGAYTKSEVTALIAQLKLEINPIGSILTTTNSANPTTYLGGTWERYAKGQVLVGVDENDADFSAIGKTGGEKSHVLDISPDRNKNEAGFTSTGREGVTGYGLSQNAAFANRPAVILDSGTNWQPKAHNNMQPYVTVYFWLRTA